MFTSVSVGDPLTSTSESPAGIVYVPGIVVAFSVSRGWTVVVEKSSGVTLFVTSAPLVPLISPVDRSSVPPFTVTVRPALTAIVPEPAFVKLAPPPD